MSFGNCSWPFLYEIGEIYFPRTASDNDNYKPQMVKLSHDVSTIYTLATYTVNQIQYHGIGKFQHVRMTATKNGTNITNRKSSLLRISKRALPFCKFCFSTAWYMDLLYHLLLSGFSWQSSGAQGANQIKIVTQIN